MKNGPAWGPFEEVMVEVGGIEPARFPGLRRLPARPCSPLPSPLPSNAEVSSARKNGRRAHRRGRGLPEYVRTSPRSPGGRLRSLTQAKNGPPRRRAWRRVNATRS